MEVQILFFGVLKDLARRQSETLTLHASATLEDVLAHYRKTNPQLWQFLPCVAISVNQEYARLSTQLNPGDEVALLPPVSGGSPDPALDAPPRATHVIPHVAIVRGRIDTQHVLDEIKRPSDGAVVMFEGIVRNQTRGRWTLYLEYESYEEMAVKQIESLVQRAMADFKIRDARIVHRLGRLEIGETSVLIVVASEHRGPAFDACRWLIDTLKRTVPIWKKEHFEDGAVWADGEPFPPEIPVAEGTQ